MCAILKSLGKYPDAKDALNNFVMYFISVFGKCSMFLFFFFFLLFFVPSRHVICHGLGRRVRLLCLDPFFSSFLICLSFRLFLGNLQLRY